MSRVTAVRPKFPRLVGTERQVLLKLMTMRLRAGWSRAKLAVTLGVMITTVARWETGKTRIPLEVVDKWCRVFGETVTVTFGEEVTRG